MDYSTWIGKKVYTDSVDPAIAEAKKIIGRAEECHELLEYDERSSLPFKTTAGLHKYAVLAEPTTDLRPGCSVQCRDEEDGVWIKGFVFLCERKGEFLVMEPDEWDELDNCEAGIALQFKFCERM